MNVYLPKDRVTSQHQGYGFVEFKSEDDADYVSITCPSCSCGMLCPSDLDFHARLLQQ